MSEERGRWIINEEVKELIKDIELARKVNISGENEKIGISIHTEIYNARTKDLLKYIKRGFTVEKKNYINGENYEAKKVLEFPCHIIFKDYNDYPTRSTIKGNETKFYFHNEYNDGLLLALMAGKIGDEIIFTARKGNNSPIMGELDHNELVMEIHDEYRKKYSLVIANTIEQKCSPFQAIR